MFSERLKWLAFLADDCHDFVLDKTASGWSLRYSRPITKYKSVVSLWEWDGLLTDGAHHMPAIKEFIKRHA